MPSTAADRRVLRFGRYAVAVGKPGKLLFPDDGVTKLDVVEHYRRVGPRFVAHAGGRPLSLQRFPDGIDGKAFFQKNASRHFPDWVERATLPKAGGTVDHVVARRTADLVYLADQGTVTFHAGLSPVGRPMVPDRLVWDLDPSVDDFGLIRHGAELLREVLDGIGLAAYLMTTGSRGLHVVAPVSGGAISAASRAAPSPRRPGRPRGRARSPAPGRPPGAWSGCSTGGCARSSS